MWLPHLAGSPFSSLMTVLCVNTRTLRAMSYEGLSCPSIFYSAVFCDLFLCFCATSFVFFLGVRGSAFLPTHQTFQLYDAMTYISLPVIIILIDWTPHSINIMMSTTGAIGSSLVSVVFKPEKPEIGQMEAPRRRTIGQIPCQVLGKEYDRGGGSMVR